MRAIFAYSAEVAARAGRQGFGIDSIKVPDTFILKRIAEGGSSVSLSRLKKDGRKPIAYAELSRHLVG